MNITFSKTFYLQIEKTHDMNSVDVRNLLLEMRKCRMGLIQTADQLRFSYLAIIEGGHSILSNGNATLDILSDYMDVCILGIQGQKN